MGARDEARRVARNGDLEAVEHPGHTQSDNEPGVESRPAEAVQPGRYHAADDAIRLRPAPGMVLGKGHGCTPSARLRVDRIGYTPFSGLSPKSSWDPLSTAVARRPLPRQVARGRPLNGRASPPREGWGQAVTCPRRGLP